MSSEDHAGAARPQRYEHTRWNFFWLVTESSAFQIGIAWVEPAAVLPLFIGRLTPSTVLLGLVMVLLRLGWVVPQIPMAILLGHRPRRALFLRWGVFFGRIPFLAFVVYLWAAGVGDPGLVLVFLMVSYAFIALGNGVVAVPLLDIHAKSIPPRMRGRFYGTIMLATAVTTLGTGYAVRRVLAPGPPEFPLDYTILFTVMAVFLSISTLGCGVAREPIRPVLDAPETLRGLIGAARELLATRGELRSLIVVAILGVGLGLAMPFYMVYASKELFVPEETAGVYIWAAMLGGAASSMIWAHLNDSRGPRSVLRGASVMIALAPLLALVVPRIAGGSALAYLFGLVFFAGGSTMGGFRMGISNYLFELASDRERARYIAIMNTLALPGSLLPLLVGWLLDYVSFEAVFALLAAGGALALATAVLMPDRKS